MSNYPLGADIDPNAPWNEVDLDFECRYCGEAISSGYYCDKNCEKADNDD